MKIPAVEIVVKRSLVHMHTQTVIAITVPHPGPLIITPGDPSKVRGGLFRVDFAKKYAVTTKDPVRTTSRDGVIAR